jgi:hypothetical protein
MPSLICVVLEMWKIGSDALTITNSSSMW